MANTRIWLAILKAWGGNSVAIAACIAFFFSGVNLTADERPNFLIIMADDCTFSDLSITEVKMQPPLTSKI